MTIICAICGVDFDIEAGKCPKCGSKRKLVTVREELRVEDWVQWIDRVRRDPVFRDRYGLRCKEISEYENEEGKPTREIRIVDTAHGILMHVIEMKDRTGEWEISRLHEERLSQP
jgi:DNA-directed RNA polymerase subunit RPC12/RpoP